MAELIEGITAEGVRSNLAVARERIAAAAARAARDPGDVEIVVAGKYVPIDALPALAAAGVTILGENRAQDLQAKVAAHGADFAWDFIGHLQSRKVKIVAPLVRLIHAVSTDSVLRQLGRHAPAGLQVLVEVDVAGEEGKPGIAPDELAGFLERCPVTVAGLMTMPPPVTDPADSRRWFSALRELASRHELRALSMGTSQDFEVAVEEGATIVRIGTMLFR